jgi:GTP-binding protein Era
MQTTTKAGYVAIIGRPNAGKSTLMNAIIGDKLSIVTPKPQTTRKRVLGIFTMDEAAMLDKYHLQFPTQMVFLDTPGILNPRYKMQSKMMDYVHNSIQEADCIVCLFDVTRFQKEQPLSDDAVKMLHNIKRQFPTKSILLLLNKIDLLDDAKQVLPMIASFESSGFFVDIIPFSALRKNNIEDIVSTIAKYIPQAPFYFDAELLSIQPERFFVSEIIRENVFLMYSNEIPYSTEVSIIEFKERELGKWFISAEIIVERDSQKGIIIGKGGEKLRRLMERSREAIEAHLQMPVYVEVYVKVRPKWRNNETYLRSFEY